MFYLSDKETRSNMHDFKCITIHYLKEYRIMDLTDTRFVGKVELFKSKEKKILNFAKGKYWETREEDADTVKIIGYWIFVSPDYESMGAVDDMEETRWILKQMADFFLKTEVRRHPAKFHDFIAKKSELTDVKTVMRRSKKPSNPEEKPWLLRTRDLMLTPNRMIERKELLRKKAYLWVITGLVGIALLIGLVFLLIFHWEKILAFIIFFIIGLYILGMLM